VSGKSLTMTTPFGLSSARNFAVAAASEDTGITAFDYYCMPTRYRLQLPTFTAPRGKAPQGLFL